MFDLAYHVQALGVALSLDPSMSVRNRESADLFLLKYARLLLHWLEFHPNSAPEFGAVSGDERNA